MATRTISTLGGNWSANTAWVEGTPPTASDDVVATVLSGNLTIDGVAGAPSVCRSANFTNYVGTLTHAATKQLDIGDASGGSLIMSSGMTYAPSSTAILNMISTTTGNSVTTAGKALGPINFNGLGGAWTITDAWTSTNRDLTLTNGSVTCNSTFSPRTLIQNGGTFTTGGTVTWASSPTLAGGTLNGGSHDFVGTNYSCSGTTVTIKTWTGTGSFSSTGGLTTVLTGNVSATSSTISGGTVTVLAGNFITTTGSLGVSGTGSLDITNFNITTNTSFSMSSSGFLKVKDLTSGTTLSFTGGTTTVTGNVSGTTVTASGSTTRTINMGNGTWSLTGTGNIWSFGNTPTNLTFNPQGSLVDCTNISATTKAVIGGGRTFNNFRVRATVGALTFNNVGCGFNILTLDAGANIKFFSGATFTLQGLSAVGSLGNLITISSSTAGVQASISKASGIVDCDYLSLQDNNAIGGASFYAGEHSTNVSNNLGWIFSAHSKSGVLSGAIRNAVDGRIMSRVMESKN